MPTEGSHPPLPSPRKGKPPGQPALDDHRLAVLALGDGLADIHPPGRLLGHEKLLRQGGSQRGQLPAVQKVPSFSKRERRRVTQVFLPEIVAARNGRVTGKQREPARWRRLAQAMTPVGFEPALAA